MIDNVIVEIKFLNPTFEVPVYAKEGDAGVDLKANINEDKIFSPGERWLCPTGIAIGLPEGTQAEIRPRSGLAINNGITVVNSPGTIDSGFRGEIGVILLNTSNKVFRVSPGDRIAQMVFMPYLKAEFTVVDKLEDSERGATGYGQSGIK